MKLDRRLELLAALAITASGGGYEDDETDNIIGGMIDYFELEEDSVPELETKDILSLITLAVEEIQDMIDEYNGFEREEETLH